MFGGCRSKEQEGVGRYQESCLWPWASADMRVTAGHLPGAQRGSGTVLWLGWKPDALWRLSWKISTLRFPTHYHLLVCSYGNKWYFQKKHGKCSGMEMLGEETGKVRAKDLPAPHERGREEMGTGSGFPRHVSRWPWWTHFIQRTTWWQAAWHRSPVFRILCVSNAKGRGRERGGLESERGTTAPWLSWGVCPLPPGIRPASGSRCHTQPGPHQLLSTPAHAITAHPGCGVQPVDTVHTISSNSNVLRQNSQSGSLCIPWDHTMHLYSLCLEASRFSNTTKSTFVGAAREGHLRARSCLRSLPSPSPVRLMCHFLKEGSSLALRGGWRASCLCALHRARLVPWHWWRFTEYYTQI